MDGNSSYFEALGAYLFFATQSQAKIERENIKDTDEAIAACYEVDIKTKHVIEELRGIVPEGQKMLEV